VRAPRAYLAGFGTSGSLLAGAALIFVLASAFVGFHGWPQVGDAPSTVAVSLAPTGSHGGSAASRALLNASASAAGRLARGVGAHGAGATGSGAAGHARRSSGNASRGLGTPSGSVSSPSSTGVPSTHQCSGSSCTPSTGPGPGPSTGPVRQIVSTAGSALNSAVSTVTQHLPSGVGGVVNKGSGTVSSTVTKVTHKLGGAVSAVGLP
jgi:hypothetical protein